MLCPICGEKMKTIDSRAEEDCTRRMRKCVWCGKKYSTREISVERYEKLLAIEKIFKN